MKVSLLILLLLTGAVLFVMQEGAIYQLPAVPCFPGEPDDPNA
jgi:hypothetical protein